jgi:hypothetical protein
MADDKYGRIFTEEDVLKIVSGFLGAAGQRFDAEDIRERIGDIEGFFPSDEPLFILRGQDKRALGCVRNYRTMAVYGVKVSREFEKGLDAAVAAFEQFRIDNPDRMKDPD